MNGTTASGISDALDRLAAFFEDRETHAGLLARRLLNRVKSGDAQLAEHLVRERRRRTRIDGSVDGSLVDTAWTAWELLDLGCPTDHAAVVRTIGYVLAQQDRPGHFAEGCSEDRHERNLCHHFMKGFFSPGGADRPLAPLSFPTGVTATSESAARFAASCAALRVVLRAGEERRASVRRHLDSVLSLAERPDDLELDGGQDLTFFALGALALAPPAYREPLQRLTRHVADRQDRDGRWDGAHLFHALDMLSSAHTSAAREALEQAAPLLCSMQLANGALDADGREEPALVAVRVLTAAAS